MKLYLFTLALTLLLAYLADTRISFSPFSISFGRGWLVLGIILIIYGCICVRWQWCDDKIKKKVIEQVEQQQEEIKESI